MLSRDIAFSHWPDGESFLQHIISGTETTPDLLLLDLNLPGISGIELLIQLEAQRPGITARMPIMVLSSMDTEESIFEALRRGAIGYILKSEIGDMEQHIATALTGGGVMSPTIAVRVITNLRHRPHPADRPRPVGSHRGTDRRLHAHAASSQQDDPEQAHLTAREEEVLDLIVSGFTAREAAETLRVSPHTVRVHIKHIYQKLYVANKVELLREARKMGYLE